MYADFSIFRNLFKDLKQNMLFFNLFLIIGCLSLIGQAVGLYQFPDFKIELIIKTMVYLALSTLFFGIVNILIELKKKNRRPIVLEFLFLILPIVICIFFFFRKLT